jgi:hypothetical protein
MPTPLRRTLLGLLALLLLAPLPAYADSGRIGDRDDDGEVPMLDFRHVDLANNESAVVVTMWFNKVTIGDLGVHLRTADGDWAGVFSEHRHPGDRNQFWTLTGRRPCRGVSVRWDDDLDKVRVRVPARCIDGGDFGDVQIRVITELGSDADLVPDARHNRWPWSRFISRG